MAARRASGSDSPRQHHEGGDAAQDALRELHSDVDREAGRLALLHRERLRCGRGCSDCCVDDLRVYEVEAERIRRAHSALLATGIPHPPGACAFLDAGGACRIYAERPYVCRTQGLPLRFYFESQSESQSEGESENDGGEIEEARDICPLNAEGPPLEQLPDEACWLIGPTEDRLARLQHERDEGRGERVALRRLFARRS